MSAAADTASGPGAKATGVLLITCLTSLVVNANTSAVSILLPSISETTGTSLATLQWAVSGYSLVGAAVIVTSGTLGDVLGRRKIFLAGIALFVVSCVLIALSKGGAGVIGGRMIQGASGATILACGMSLLSVATEGPERIRAVSLWGAAAAAGAAAGPLLGGVFEGTIGWQALFWLDAAIAAVCIPWTLSAIAESRDPDRPRSIDVAGTVLVALTLAPAILALSEGSDWGWLSAPTLGCFALAIASAIGFVFVEGRVAVPLVDLSLLRNRVLVGSALAILIAAGAINGIMYILSLYFQNPAALDMTALQAGIATLPATVLLIAVAPAISKLAVKFGSRQVVGAGFVLMTAGFALLALITESWDYWPILLPIVLVATGMGLANGPASSASTSCVDEGQVGAASGISNMMRYVGAAVATAAVAAIYAGAAPGDAPTGAQLADGVAGSAVLMAVVSGLGIAMVALFGRHRPREPQRIDRAAAAAAAAHTLPVAAEAAPATSTP